jgi:hypothetical protein
MPDEVPSPEFVEDFKALYDDETDVVLTLSKYHAWCVMSAIQLAQRHPEARKVSPIPIQVASEVAVAIQKEIATTPALAKVAQDGWAHGEARA